MSTVERAYVKDACLRSRGRRALVAIGLGFGAVEHCLSKEKCSKPQRDSFSSPGLFICSKRGLNLGAKTNLTIDWKQLEVILSLFSYFSQPQGWIELIVLMFLEMALGIDNLVFIAITTARLPKEKQHIGRRLGLIAAMVMRCLLLCFVTALMSLTKPLFVLPFGLEHGTTVITVRSLIFLAGGIYLIYKGIVELKEAIYEQDSDDGDEPRRAITLPKAVALIMVMDIVFSLDSVITAAGLSGHIAVMCIAVIGAVTVMIIFADIISNFINSTPEVKIVALCFVFMVGVMLLMEGVGVETVAGIPLNSLLYCMMAFGLVVALLIMWQRRVREGYAKKDELDEPSTHENRSTEQ